MHITSLQALQPGSQAAEAPALVQALRTRADIQISRIYQGDSSARAIRELGEASRQSVQMAASQASASPRQAAAAYAAQV
jgi:hypothetical protein